MKPSIRPNRLGPMDRSFARRDEPVFWNLVFDKSRLRSFISWFLKSYGEKKTLALLERLKQIGFEYATKAGISLGVEDLKIPAEKNRLLAKAEASVSESNFLYRKGRLTGLEKMQKFIETWHETSETLKDDVVRNFERTNILNPVYMMAFSGARGNMSQVRQLVGMRGLMADPQGKIIDFPIQSNFREGLTLTEYLISTYGARKGIVDTALRTATAGYLTRRLVDVAQHVIVSKFDCGTRRGIYLFDMKEGNKVLYSFQNRLIGRVLAHDISDGSTEAFPIAFRNQEVTSELASMISKIRKKALVRSPLTCENRKLVCQLCYGWSLATSRLVSIGEAVGVIAGQSIGEPGTQLTMRTFHTGGVFAAGVTQQINAPFSGTVEYAEAIAGTCVRTPHGQLAFLTKSNGVLFVKKTVGEPKAPIAAQTSEIQKTYKIPPFTILFVRHGQSIEQDALVCQISSLPINVQATQTIEQTIYSTFEGEVYYDEIDLNEDVEEKYGERISTAENWSRVWLLSGKLYEQALDSKFLPSSGDFVRQNTIVEQVGWIAPVRSSSPNWAYHLQTRRSSRVPRFSNFGRYGPRFAGTPKLPRNLDAASIVDKLANYRLTSLYAVKRRFLEARKPPFFSMDTKTFKPLASIFYPPYGLQDDSVGPSVRLTTSLSSLWNFDRPSSLRSISRIFERRLGLFQNPASADYVATFFSTKRVRNNLVPRLGGFVSTSRSNIDDERRSSSEPAILRSYLPVVLRAKTLRTYLFSGRIPVVSKAAPSFYSFRLNALRKDLRTSFFEGELFLSDPKNARAFDAELRKSEALASHEAKENVMKGQQTGGRLEHLGASLARTTSAQVETKNEAIRLAAKKAFLGHKARQRTADSPSKKITVSFPLVSLKTRSAKYSRLGYVLSLDSITDRFFVSSPLNLRDDTNGVRHLIRKKAPPSTFSFDWFPDVESYNLRGIIFVDKRSFFNELFNKTLGSLESPAKSATKQGTRAFDFKNTWPLFDLSNSQLQKVGVPQSKSERVERFASKRFFGIRSANSRSDEFDKCRLLSIASRTSQTRFPDIKRRFVAYLGFGPSASDRGRNFRKAKEETSKYFEQAPEKISTDTKQVLSTTARKDFQSLKNAFLKLNRFHKLSSCSNEIEWLKQENYRFRIEKKAIAPNVFELQPRFAGPRAGLNIAFENVNFYLSNAQGSKKNFSFHEEGLLSLKVRSQQSNSSSKLSSSELRNGLIFKKKDSRKTFRLTFNSQNRRESVFGGPKDLTQSLRLGFLAHVAKKASKITSETFLRSNANIATVKTFYSSSNPIEKSDCFTFVPFIEPKNRLDSDGTSSRNSKPRSTFSVCSTTGSGIESLSSDFAFVDFSVKPGWIYRSNGFSRILRIHKSHLRAGTDLFENVAFEQNKVSLELLTQTSGEKTLCSYELFFGSFDTSETVWRPRSLSRIVDSRAQKLKRSDMFTTTVYVRNQHVRFLNPRSNSRFGSKRSFLVLIRPVYSKTLPTEHDMKTRLYDKVKSNHRFNYLISGRCYMSYSSTFSNPQKNTLKTIGHFVPVDLEVATTSIRRIVSRSTSEVVPVIVSRRSVAKARNGSQSRNEISKSRGKGVSGFDGHVCKKTSNLSIHGYFSNRCFNFFRVKVSFLDDYTSLSSRRAFSFSRVSIHRGRSKETPFGSSVDSSRYALSFANQRKNAEVLKNHWFLDRACLSTTLTDFWSFESDRERRSFVNLEWFESLPVFEYSFCSLHAYFANQRIFAAFFSNFLNVLPKRFASSSSSRFVERPSTFSTGADAFANLPKAANSFVLRNGEFTELVASTGFRIPFEGEILKGASEHEELGDFEKHSNVNLERGLSQQSRFQKIVLTKDDIVDLSFISESSPPEDLGLEARFERARARAKLRASLEPTDLSRFFQNEKTKEAFASLLRRHSILRNLERRFTRAFSENTYNIVDFKTTYGNKSYRLNAIHLEFLPEVQNLRLGKFVQPGQKLYGDSSFMSSGQIIHLNSRSVTLRKAEFFSVSPKAILHTYNRAGLGKNVPVMTLPFETLKTGDIVQGIPKVEQFLEARTTIKGRLFLNSLPVLLEAIHYRYVRSFELEKAVRQSFLKIQQILVDGVQRVYRSQGVSIADKHLEVIVRQMTSKVRIVHGAQTGFFSGELVDLEFVERLNRFLKVKIRYEPVVLGITRASLEVDSFLSAASFQQTTKVLTKAAVENRRDFLRGLKESLLVGNLLPAGTGYIVPFSSSSTD